MAMTSIGSLRLEHEGDLAEPRRIKQRWFAQNKFALCMSLPCFMAAVILAVYGESDHRLWFLSVVCLILGSYFIFEPFSTPLWKLVRRQKTLKHVEGKLIGFSRHRESSRPAVSALFVFNSNSQRVEVTEVFSWQGFPRGNDGFGGRFIEPIAVHIVCDPGDLKTAAVAGISPQELRKLSDSNLYQLKKPKGIV